MPFRLALSLWITLAAAVASAASEPWMGQEVLVAPDVYTPSDTAPEAAPADAEGRFAEAQRAAEAGRHAEAFALAGATLHADADHAAARRVLGYELVDGAWRTPYEARQHRRGVVWDRRFGWVRADDLPRYEGGERRAGRRWVSAEQDAADHAAIDSGWQVRTDHFVVQTNHSLEAGARLAADLEGLFQAWRTLFAGYAFTDREARQLFAGERDARKPRRPMRVFYHRDKGGYVEHLRRRQPRIAETLGIYFDDTRESHFYHDPSADADQLRATLYHEAAHQLFRETGPRREDTGRDANFWLVEGVACYFELLAPIDGRAAFTLGHPAQGRLPSAVARGPAAPLAELAAMGQSELQRLPNLANVYAQATGVVAMLRHGEHAAADRDALDQTLRAVYAGKADAETLSRSVGRSYGDLDRQYRAFLTNLSR